MIALEKSNAVVLVFKMEGCPACADYLPVFLAVAQKYTNRVPWEVMDADKPDVQDLANRHDIEGMPTTLVLRRGSARVHGVEGAITAAEVEKIFQQALAWV